jgi:hypothetical protein
MFGGHFKRGRSGGVLPPRLLRRCWEPQLRQVLRKHLLPARRASAHRVCSGDKLRRWGCALLRVGRLLLGGLYELHNLPRRHLLHGPSCNERRAVQALRCGQLLRGGRENPLRRGVFFKCQPHHFVHAVPCWPVRQHQGPQVLYLHGPLRCRQVRCRGRLRFFVHRPVPRGLLRERPHPAYHQRLRWPVRSWHFGQLGGANQRLLCFALPPRQFLSRGKHGGHSLPGWALWGHHGVDFNRRMQFVPKRKILYRTWGNQRKHLQRMRRGALFKPWR